MHSRADCEFIDASFPGFVECEFVDGKGRKHLLVDKLPIVTTKLLDASSAYPTGGIVRCEVLDRLDDGSRQLVRITTARPDGVESTEDLSGFVVVASDIRPDSWSSS